MRALVVRTFFVLLVATSAFAQTTSSLSGTVTSDGSPLPGVTVTISSPALQGTRTTVSGATGDYNFPALPPGDYKITFALEGLQEITKTTVLKLTQPSSVDADLKATIAEAITVTATTPLTLETSEVSTNISAATLDTLPTRRTVLAALALAPAVAPGLAGRADDPALGFSVSGAASSDSLYVINGVVVNEGLRGQPHSLFVEDAIQETTILTAGISAEYGRFTGGVINTITKSGGNEFHGSLRDTITNPAWTLQTPIQTADNRDSLGHTYEGTLGGYVLKDRLWFFTAGRMQKIDEPFSTFNTAIPYTRTTDQKRLEGKLTARLGESHSLVGTYLDVKHKISNDRQFEVMDLDSLINRELPNSLLSFNYNGILTNNLLIEAVASNKKFQFVGSGSQFTDLVHGTLLVDATNTNRRWWTSTFCGVCTDEERNNKLYTLKTNYFLAGKGPGSHNIAVGVEDFAEERIANNNQSGSDYRLIHTVIRNGTDLRARFDANTIIQWNPIFSSSSGNDLQTRSAFVNDRWDFNDHFTFNLGVRYDKNNVEDADGNVVSDDSAFSPRLGVQYDLRGDGRHRLNASYSKYVNHITDGNVAGAQQAAGNPSVVQWSYGGPTINPAGTPFSELTPTDQAIAQVFAWFQSVGGTDNKSFLLGSAVSGVATRLAGSLVSPSVDEITAGYGLQLGPRAILRADLVKRDWKNFYATVVDTTTGTVTDPLDNEGDLALVTNTNDIERHYRAAILSGQWSPARWNIGGNYTYATLKGNDETEGVTTGSSPTTPLGLFYAEFLGYENRLPIGYLAEDVRHRARAWVGYDFAFGRFGEANVSLLQQYSSGQAYSAIGQIDATGRTAGTAYAGLPSVPEYTLSQAGTRHNYYFTDRGALRTDAFSSTDIGATYRLPIGIASLFVQGNIENVLNRNAVIVPNTTVITRRTGGAASGLRAFNPFTDTPVECPQGAAAAQCTALGANWQKGPNFGNAIDINSYQRPRTYRLSAGLRFSRFPPSAAGFTPAAFRGRKSETRRAA
jgi:outer membrane receptor protein involved in Fe transport